MAITSQNSHLIYLYYLVSIIFKLLQNTTKYKEPTENIKINHKMLNACPVNSRMRMDYLLLIVLLIMFCESLAKCNWIMKPNVTIIISNMNMLYVSKFRLYD